MFNMMVSKDYLKAYGPDRDSATGSVTTASTPTVAPLNVWFHAAATFDGSQIRIYQDGVEQGFDTWTSPLPSATAPLYLATKKVINYAHPFIGLLDEVMLYDRALPPEAIAALARANVPRCRDLPTGGHLIRMLSCLFDARLREEERRWTAKVPFASVLTWTGSTPACARARGPARTAWPGATAGCTCACA